MKSQRDAQSSLQVLQVGSVQVLQVLIQKQGGGLLSPLFLHLSWSTLKGCCCRDGSAGGTWSQKAWPQILPHGTSTAQGLLLHPHWLAWGPDKSCAPK